MTDQSDFGIESVDQKAGEFDHHQDRNVQIQVTSGQAKKVLRPVLTFEDAAYWTRRIDALVSGANTQIITAW